MRAPVKREVRKMPDICPLKAKAVDAIIAKLEAAERAAKAKQVRK